MLPGMVASGAMVRGGPVRRGPAAVLEQVRLLLALGRMHTAGITGMMPVLGAWLSGGAPGWRRGLLLFVIGLLNHYYGLALNELHDAPIDRRCAELARKPLVSGAVSERLCAWTGYGAGVLGLGLLVVLGLPWAAVALDALALLLVLAYDALGKRVPGLDGALALSAGVGVLFGPVALGWAPSGAAWLLAGLFSVQLLLQNTVAGLKDLAQDAAAGAVSFARWLGCAGSRGVRHVTRRFLAWLWGVKLAHLGLFLPGLGGAWGLSGAGRWLLAALLLVNLGAFLRLPGAVPRRRFLLTLAVHEASALLGIVVLFSPELGPWGVGATLLAPTACAALVVGWAHGGRPPAL
jgi:4-hydroxybenzoate polyprenyltransferase